MDGFGIDIPINPRLLAIVREFERTRDNPACIRKLEAMLADGEDFYLVHWSLAWAYRREGRVKDALAEGLAAVELDPGYGENYFDLGTWYEKLGDYEKAVEAYRRAGAMSPVDPRPVANLGLVLMRLGRFVEAEATLDEALRRDPRDVVAAAQIGLARQFAEDQRQGREVMDVHFHEINSMQSVNRDPQSRSLGRRVLWWWLTRWFGPGRGGHGPTAGPGPAPPGQGAP